MSTLIKTEKIDPSYDLSQIKEHTIRNMNIQYNTPLNWSKSDHNISQYWKPVPHLISPKIEINSHYNTPNLEITPHHIMAKMEPTASFRPVNETIPIPYHCNVVKPYVENVLSQTPLSPNQYRLSGEVFNMNAIQLTTQHENSNDLRYNYPAMIPNTPEMSTPSLPLTQKESSIEHTPKPKASRKAKPKAKSDPEHPLIKVENVDKITKKRNAEILLVCTYCMNVYNDKFLFVEHFSNHFDYPVCCRSCRREFSCLEGYNCHKNLYLCENSNNGTDVNIDDIKQECDPEEPQNRNSHSNKRFSCRMCGDFFTKKQLDIHVQQHNKYRCKNCPLTFTNRVKALEHQRRTATAARQLKTNPPSNSPTDTSLSDSFTKSDSYSTVSESTVTSLLSNLSSGGSYFCAAEIIGHTVTGLEPRFKCPMCPRVFHKNNKRQNHVDAHTKNILVICPECGIGYHNKTLFENHIKVTGHARDKNQSNGRGDLGDAPSRPVTPHVCHICSKQYAKKSSLQQHILKGHANQEIYKCPLCDMTTSLKCNLDRHMALHTEPSRQVVCDQCGAAFYSGTALKEHVMYIHNQEREHKCPHCVKSFVLKNALSRHITSSHTTERPHTCSECTQSYKRSSHLRRHITSAHPGGASAESAGNTKSSDSQDGNEITNSRRKNKGIQRMVTNEAGEFVPIIEEKKIPSAKRRRPNQIKSEPHSDSSNSSKPSVNSSESALQSSLMSSVPSTSSGDQMFSLMDVNSGELVTMSVAEMHKNSLIKSSVIDISNADLLELWPNSNVHVQSNPMDMTALQTHPQSSQYTLSETNSSGLMTATRPSSGFMSLLQHMQSAGQLLVSDQNVAYSVTNLDGMHTLTDISNTFLRGLDVQQMEQNMTAMDALTCYQQSKEQQECANMILMPPEAPPPPLQYNNSDMSCDVTTGAHTKPHTDSAGSHSSTDAPGGQMMPSLPDYLQHPFQYM